MKRFFGCVVGLILFVAIAYAIVAGAGFVWWGRGFVAPLAARHSPSNVASANVVHVYDHVITTERDRVVFQRSNWARARWSFFVGLAFAGIGLLAFAIKGLLAAGRRYVVIALGFGICVAITTFLLTRKPPVVVARGDTRPITIRHYTVGGGRSGTRHTTGFGTGYDILIGGSTVLVRLPWNEEKDARVWREIVRKKVER